MPLVGSLALRLPLYVFPRPFAHVADLSGDDTFVYELGGAAMLGYVVALALGSRGADWREIRFVAFAVYAFELVAFLAGFASFLSGQVLGLAIVVSLWAVFTSWAFAQILLGRRGTAVGPPDVATWTIAILILATISAAVFGLGPQLPQAFAAIFGYRGTDEYVYRLAGAACFGYAIMGIAELRSRAWGDMRLPNIAALVFNALAFLASMSEILAGRTTLLAALVALAAGAFTLAFVLVLVRRGR